MTGRGCRAIRARSEPPLGAAGSTTTIIGRSAQIKSGCASDIDRICRWAEVSTKGPGYASAHQPCRRSFRCGLVSLPGHAAIALRPGPCHHVAMAAITGLSARVISDIHHGRHREAYALFLVGVVLVALGFADVLSIRALISAILLALSFLVFHTSAEASLPEPSLDQVLSNRETYGSFSKLLPGVRDLRFYGPTAVTIMVNAADIRRLVLKPGGNVRVIVQDDSPESVRLTAMQLDDSLDLERTLHSSLAVLQKMSADPAFSYRSLALNPGFSLTIFNANDSKGYLIFESQGFKSEYADRMHIVISKAASPQWFSYWVETFEVMWQDAKPPPDAAGSRRQATG